MKLYQSLLHSPFLLLLFFIGIVVSLYLLYVAKMRNVDNVQGDNNKDIAFYHEVLNARLKTLGPDHPDVAIAYNGLGIAYDNRGDHDKAIACYTKALKILLKRLGAGHPDVGIAYHNLGMVYHAKGDYDKAITLHHKALEICLANLGAEHPDIAKLYNRIF